jgi:hypothetical protein
MAMEQTAQPATAATKLIQSDNPSPEELAAFIDGRLSTEDRARLEAYFSSNPSARRELIDASRIVATLPASERRRTRWIPLAGIAAAAAIVVLLVRPADHARLPGIATSGQRGVAEQSQTIALVSPAVDESVADAGPRDFVWRSVDGATYRLIVSDASGKTLLQQDIADTVVAMPLAIASNTPGTYYWSVDALESDGSSVTSGARAFTIGKK